MNPWPSDWSGLDELASQDILSSEFSHDFSVIFMNTVYSVTIELNESIAW